jgi:hypothetical protein
MAYAFDADSRDYVIAYEIHSNDGLPPDFLASSRLDCFDAAVFLPRSDPQVFGRSSYPPRLLALTGDRLTILPHPSANEQPQFLGLQRLCFIESGHVLLRGWLRFTGRDFDRNLFYNRRDAGPVEAFLGKIRANFLGRSGTSGGSERIDLGDPLDFKFRQALEEELTSDEVAQAVLFRPVREYERALLRRRRRWPADLIALTSRRLLWITDLDGSGHAYYGSIARYAALANIARIQRESEGNKWILRVDFHCSEQHWVIPLAKEHYESATWFETALA